jgi:hypothetical protein
MESKDAQEKLKVVMEELKEEGWVTRVVPRYEIHLAKLPENDPIKEGEGEKDTPKGKK